MATNGRGKVLTKRQQNKLLRIKQIPSLCRHLEDMGIQYQSVRYVLQQGRCSEKTYNKLVENNLI
jgi:hypothetical protein